MAAATETEVQLDGRRLRLSNLDKVFYPETGFTKGEVIDYYARVAPVMLPHLAGRAVTMRRFPDGVEGNSFYAKNCPAHAPDWVGTVTIESEDTTTEHCVLNDTASLVWAANLAAIELHTPMALGDDPDAPTMLVLDLDPGAPADVIDCAEVALWLRDLLGEDGLRCWPKTSGSKGLQLYVPLHTPATYEQTAGFARTLARRMEREAPERVVSTMRKDRRRGKVFIDWSQNARHKTTVCAYSLRARPRPTVSTPVRWDEIDQARSAGDAGLLTFEAGEVLERVDGQGDLFAPVLEVEQELPGG